MAFVSTKTHGNNGELQHIRYLTASSFTYRFLLLLTSTSIAPNIPTYSNQTPPPQQPPQKMCTAKARVAKCGHTVEYEIMIPCPTYPGSGPPCPAWDEQLLNKALLKGYPVCIACHVQKEKTLCRQLVDAERDLRFAGRWDASPKETWEARLRNGVKMQAEVLGLDKKVGREGAWREEARRWEWRSV